MTVTRGKTIAYVDDTITKKVIAKFNATSFGVQFIWITVKSLKANISLQFMFTSEQDFVGKYDVKTQPPLFKTIQF